MSSDDAMRHLIKAIADVNTSRIPAIIQAIAHEWISKDGQEPEGQTSFAPLVAAYLAGRAETQDNWTSCDTPPGSDRALWLTTCPHGGIGHRKVHAAKYANQAWWTLHGARIQDVPVSWMDDNPPMPDQSTKAPKQIYPTQVSICKLHNHCQPSTQKHLQRDGG